MSACLHQPRSVSLLTPTRGPIRDTAAFNDNSGSCSRASRTRRTRAHEAPAGTSSVLASAHLPVGSEPPANPGRFTDGYEHLEPLLPRLLPSSPLWPIGEPTTRGNGGDSRVCTKSLRSARSYFAVSGRVGCCRVEVPSAGKPTGRCGTVS